MPDENMLMAKPDEIQAGGGITDKVGEFVGEAIGDFVELTEFDPQDPPWGDDHIGHGFAENYVEPHADLVAAVEALERAVRNAARLTLDSGKNFQDAQNDALDRIRQNRGGRH